MGRCWRVKSGKYLCSGETSEVRDLVVSIPVLLIARVEDDGDPWNFPATLAPETSLEGVEYDLVALGLFSEQKSHFSARFTILGRDGVYGYDGMLNGGCPTRIEGATPATHMYGVHINLPDDWKVQHAFYYLRGGSKAQQEYYAARLNDVSFTHLLRFTSHSLTTPTLLLFTDEEFRLMAKADRHWVKDPFRVNAIEHLRRDAPQTPYKHVIETPESEDSSTEEQSPQRSSSSAPDSLFGLNCRCGLKGNGNVGYVQDDGEAVQCDTCMDWMHVACQQGEADVGPKTKFNCERCEPLKKGYVLPYCFMSGSWLKPECQTHKEDKPTRGIKEITR